MYRKNKEIYEQHRKSNVIELDDMKFVLKPRP